MKPIHLRNLSLGLVVLLMISLFVGAGNASRNPYISNHGVSFSTGNKYLRQNDISLSGPVSSLSFSRNYNSQSVENTVLGFGWSFSWNEKLNFEPELDLAIYTRSDGKMIHFTYNGTDAWINSVGKKAIISENVDGSGYTMILPTGTKLLFGIEGRLIEKRDHNNNSTYLTYVDDKLTAVADGFGRSLTFNYNTTDKVSSITTPVGVYTYSYDANENLVSVTRPDAGNRTYIYEDPNDIHNLTGVIDESSALVLSVGYDIMDRVVTSSLKDGSKAVSIEYQSGYKRVITDSLGVPTTYQLEVLHGVAKVKSYDGPGCSSCGSDTGSEYTYDFRQQVTAMTDGRGYITTYTYDDLGNKLTETKVVGTPEEFTTSYTYDSNLNKVETITKPSVSNPSQSLVTTMSYNGSGNMLTRTESGYSGSTPMSRTTTYNYDSYGRVISIDGPRADVDDVTTITYYPNDPGQGNNRGYLHTVSNALGHTVTYSSYNVFGQAELITDANGLTTESVYNTMGHMSQRTTGGLSTTYAYDIVGNLQTVTLPGNKNISYQYTPAGQVQSITDSLGNSIAYTYDSEGRKSDQQIKDPLGTLTAYVNYQYDDTGRLHKAINPDESSEQLNYDQVGNLVTQINELGVSTNYSYDSLNRLQEVEEPGSATTRFTYDLHGHQTSVTDAEGGVTTFSYDDFGNRLSRTSPDTGITTYVYDTASNLINKTDANGTVVNYVYDTLNRINAITYSDSSLNITYTYDEGTNSIGRLSTTTDGTGSTNYTFNTFGNLIEEFRTIEGQSFTIRYNYNDTQELASITYPSGREVIYQRDAIGQVTDITSVYEGKTTTVASSITNLPFGPATSLTLGNGLTLATDYDEQYRLTSSTAGDVYNKTYTYLLTGQVETINDELDINRSQAFTYDDLGRLTGALGSYGNLGFTYDRVGNRLSKTVDALQTQYTYQTETNRLDQIIGSETTSYSYDTAGNTLSKDDLAFTWNENNRISSLDINAENTGTYGYDARGLRTVKTTEEGTVLSLYDSSGNLLAETDETGATIREYVYLGSKRLTLFDYTVAPEFTVKVSTSKDELLENIPTYAFHETGSYVGIYATTNEQGAALYAREAFGEGPYQFRVDYLGAQFWSNPVTVQQTNSVSVIIDVDEIETIVTMNGEVQKGVNVYVFSESGSYLGIFGVTDSEGRLSFTLPVGENYRFRADLYGNQYWSDVTSIGGGSSASIETGGGILNFSVLKDIDNPMADIKTYLFSDSTTYLGFSQTTDSSGLVSYTVPIGSYKLRVDFLGYQFWSDSFTVTEDTNSELMIPHQDVAVTVSATMNSVITPLEAVNCFLFTPSGAYQNVTAQTDANGQAVFNIPQVEYRVRADYLNQQYWTIDFTSEDTAINIQHGTAVVEVTNIELPVTNVSVSAFSDSGTYLNRTGVTNDQGTISFDLPAGTYRFRADYQGGQYWGDDTVLVPNQYNPVLVSTGGGSFLLTLADQEAIALVGIRAYVFSESGSYLGEYANTDNNGQVSFNLADGIYKMRIDYLGYQYWTENVSIPTNSSLTYVIAHRQVQVNVLTQYSGTATPLADADTYLFLPNGSYMGLSTSTDANGHAYYYLPYEEYKVRVDYLNAQYFSEPLTADMFSVEIDEGQAQVHLSSGGTPLENVSVFVFSESNTYLGISGQTEADGTVLFQLPAGLYKFRVDYQSSQFWSSDEVMANVVNDINLRTGGGTLAITVRTDDSTILEGVNCFLFSSSGSYLGQRAVSDENGLVSFDVADGNYKVRVDYLGAQYWSDAVGVPGVLSTTILIEHRDVIVSVVEDWDEETAGPLPGIRAYLFTASGSYTGIYTTTDERGEAHFSVPYQNYTVRADYLGSQYWSATFIWQNTTITIAHGELALTVYENDAVVEGASAYLFTEAGSYLEISSTTDSAGRAIFRIPEASYQIRIDLAGEQYWTELINVLPHQINEFDYYLDDEILSFESTNNPHPDYWHGEPPVYQPMLASNAASLTGMLAQITTQAILSDEARTFYYISDHLGTGQLVTDDTGAVVWYGEYSPFGEVDVVVNQLDNSFRFPGQILDPESGLYYNWHRFYDPDTGRYISADPIGLAGGLNLYAYANQNPINATDPYGLYSWTGLNAAWSNYCSGSRTPWFATFGSIDWGNYEADLKARISSLVGGGSCCKPKNSYETFTISAQTGGADRFLIGRHNLKAVGRLIVNADCSWSFSGTISSASGVDPYNFNPSNRGFVGETTTWIGRNRCPNSGRTFDINIVGVGYVNLSGK